MGLEQIQVELQDWMGSDRKIAEAAWTSSIGRQQKETKTDEDVERLVKMMASSGHGTPFEAVVMRFWVRMPIFTDRQHMTHRVATHNGLSARYRTMPSDFYHLGVLDEVTHIIGRALNGTDEPTINKNVDQYNILCKKAYDFYNDLLSDLRVAKKDNKISDAEYKRVREIVRGVLPVSGMVERVSIFNLRSFCNYMRHRLSPHAQLEIQEVAKKMLQEVKNKDIAPIAIAELETRNWLIEPDISK